MRGRVSRGAIRPGPVPRKRAGLMRLGAVLALSAMAAGPAIGAPSDVGDGGVPAFYAWSGALPASVGVVLAEEPLPDAFSVPGAAKAVRILYTARDGIDDKSVVPVSAAVFLPRGTPPEGGWPVMAWAHGTTGIADICVPSARPRGGRGSH